MIRVEGLRAVEAPLAVGPLTFDLDGGTHAILGRRADGVSLLLDALAGRIRPKAGRITVGGEPVSSPNARRRIAHVPLESRLPDALRVEEALYMAALLRGDPESDASRRLEELDLGSLARRFVRSLSREEARAVTLAEGISSPSVEVLLIEEPFFAMDPRAAGKLEAALARKKDSGACIVVGTASTRDVRRLSREALLLDRGDLVHRGPSSAPWLAMGPNGFRLDVDSSNARELVARLLEVDADTRAISAMSTFGDRVVLHGPNEAELARAASRAAATGVVTIHAMTLHASPLENVRAALSAAPTAARAPGPPGEDSR